MSSHRIVRVMGTVFSVDVRDRHVGTTVLDALAGYWRRVDATFSTYLPASDISRLARGEIGIADAHPDVATVLTLCAEAAARTGGFFSATAAGRLDPSGLVKGWSVEQGARILRAAGAGAFCINGGGDVWVAGEPEPGRPWSVGVADPADPGRVLAVVRGPRGEVPGTGSPGQHGLAVATSGTAERGAHVVNPFTGRPTTDLVAVTVAGPSLTWADAYATAAMAMGRRAMDWLGSLPGYAAIAVRADGSIWHAPGSWPQASDRRAGCPRL
jgi:FAD:protein FMN transferase